MRKPFFQNAHVTVYLGNALDVLQEMKSEGLHFDLLLTDPPYGLNQKESKTSGINAKRGKAMYSGKYFDDTLQYMNETVRPIVEQSLAISTLGIVTGGIGSYRWLPPPQEEGCMYMPASPSFNSWAHCDFQPIFYYGKPKGNTGRYRKLSHQVSERGFSKHHPCSKPLEFWKKLMLCGTDGVRGKTILDPFGGSGTTGRAAQELGMRSVIVEINPKYCELIAKNCAQEFFDFTESQVTS